MTRIPPKNKQITTLKLEVDEVLAVERTSGKVRKHMCDNGRCFHASYSNPHLLNSQLADSIWILLAIASTPILFRLVVRDAYI